MDNQKFTAWLKTQPAWVSIFILCLIPLYFIVKGLFRLHMLRPWWTVAFYSTFLSIMALLVGDWLTGVLLIVLPALAFKYLRKPLEERKRMRVFRNTVVEIMEGTLWNPEQFKAKTYVQISKTHMPEVMRVDFTTPLGQHDEAVLKTLPIFSAGLNLASIIPLPDEDAFDGVVSLLFCKKSPLDNILDASKAPVLNLGADASNPYHWLAVGVDSIGQPYELPIFLKDFGATRQLCGGATGSGKSSILMQQFMFAVRNPVIDVVCTDGKGSEFDVFKPFCISYTSQPTTKDFFAQLRFLEDEKIRRATVLAENKAMNPDRFSTAWNPIDDGNFLLWIFDELGSVQAQMSSQQKSEFQTRLYGLLSVARSLGIACIFSSQTWKADMLSTQIRDNCFDVFLGFKMNSNQESAYIGFDLDDEVNPSKIKGHFLREGMLSCAGTFAMKGIDRNAYGRSYFLHPTKVIAPALRDLEPLPDVEPQPSLSAMEIEEEDTKVFQSELSELMKEETK